MAVGIFEPVVIGCGFRRHEALGQPGLFHQLHLKTRRGHDVDGEAAGFRFGVGPLQDALAGAAVKGRLDRRIFFLEGVDQGDDLLVVERAIEYNLAFGAGGVIEGGGVSRGE